MPPKLIECEPFVQVNVSENCQTGAFLRLGPVETVAPLMPAAPMPMLNPS
ncbi:MAG: hypothetical protein IPJ07_20440 [Acidobacteria bacterium]|nr:hypothetical protein [Acidobacteriota bacterium]